MEKATRLTGVVEKGWGYEMIWATNEHYCGKIMVFNREGAKTSMHFHKEKDETWFVNSGKFKVAYIDTNNSTLYEKELGEGATWHNPPLQPHQLICLTKPESKKTHKAKKIKAGPSVSSSTLEKPIRIRVSIFTL